MIVLLLVVAVATVVGVALLGVMVHRDEPVLGMYGLITLMAAGIVASAYGVQV